MKIPLPAPGEVRKRPAWSNLNKRARLLGLSFIRSEQLLGTRENLGLYQVRRGSTVLGGHRFEMTLDHVDHFLRLREGRAKTTASEAKQKDGPASAPTLPGHSSNNPAKGNAVNEQHDTTAPALPAMPDFEKAFYGLEELIYVVQRRVKAVEFLVDGIDARGMTRGPHDPVHVHREELDALHSTARDAAWGVDDLSRRFDSVIAEVVSVESVIREARKASQNEAEGASPPVVVDPLLHLVRTYEAGIAAYNVRDDEGEKAIQATYGHPFEVLTNGPVPEPTTMQGALAALRLLVNESKDDLDRGIFPTVLLAVLAYLEADVVHDRQAQL